jgi:hypothetical protein
MFNGLQTLISDPIIINKATDDSVTNDSLDPENNADSGTHVDLETFSEHDNHIVKADDSVTYINNQQLTDFSEINEGSGSDMEIDSPDNTAVVPNNVLATVVDAGMLPVVDNAVVPNDVLATVADAEVLPVVNTAVVPNDVLATVANVLHSIPVEVDELHDKAFAGMYDCMYEYLYVCYTLILQAFSFKCFVIDSLCVEMNICKIYNAFFR